jgi:hypothetical protein
MWTLQIRKNADMTIKVIANIKKCVSSDIPVQFVTNSLRMESVRLDIVARIGTQRVVNTGKEIRKDVSGDNYADTCMTNLKKEWKKTVKKKVWAQ